MADCLHEIKQAERGREAAAVYRGTAGLVQAPPAGSGGYRVREAPTAKFVEKLL
ncbi:MAG: hypothetical protein AB1767_09125 [Bacillota bacterium]